MQAIIYHNPNSNESRYVLKYLQDNHISSQARLYMVGITRQEILDILRFLKCDIREIIHYHENILRNQYNSCNSRAMYLSKEWFINKIIDHPILLERPIVLFPKQGIGSIVRSQNSLNSLFEYVGIKHTRNWN